MDLDRAISELNKLPHMHTLENITEAEWAKRAPFIHVVEEAVSDRSYVRQRDALIPEAAGYADSHTERLADGSYHSRNWTTNFLWRMDMLWHLAQATERA